MDTHPGTLVLCFVPNLDKKRTRLDQMFLDLDFQKVALGLISSVPLVSESCKALPDVYFDDPRCKLLTLRDSNAFHDNLPVALL